MTIHIYSNSNDGDEVAKDGDVLRVPIYLADGVSPMFHDGMGNLSGHKPGYCFATGATRTLSDAQRDAARDEYKRRLRDAWRRPAARQTNSDDGENSSEAAYAARGEWLRNAWKGGR